MEIVGQLTGGVIHDSTASSPSSAGRLKILIRGLGYRTGCAQRMATRHRSLAPRDTRITQAGSLAGEFMLLAKPIARPIWRK